MNPEQQWRQVADALHELGKRISWLERTVYGAVGGVVVASFVIANHLKVG